MKRTGIFGGTFDPPTKAHKTIALAALENLSLDQILFLPTYQNPHKLDRKPTSSQIRLEMLQTVVSSNKSFAIETCEIERRGVSYTYDTLIYLRKKYVNSELYFIQGADSLKSFHRWYRFEDLLKLATFVFFPRVGWEMEGIEKKILEQTIQFDTPRLDISSTLVRDHIRDGKSVEDFLDDPIIKIVEKYKLYQK